MVVQGQEGGRGLDWEFGISRCKLVYTEWIKNTILLYSAGIYIQYPAVNHNGQGYNCNYSIYVIKFIIVYINMKNLHK